MLILAFVATSLIALMLQAQYCKFRIHRSNTFAVLFLNARRWPPLIVSIILRKRAGHRYRSCHAREM